jgi:hypothetical protein
MPDADAEIPTTDVLPSRDAAPETTPEVQRYERSIAAVRAQRHSERLDSELFLIKRP